MAVFVLTEIDLERFLKECDKDFNQVVVRKY